MFKADQPIKTYSNDLLERKDFAASLAHAILSYKEIDSISIGLFGKWGSGKTSIINMTLEEIESVSSDKSPLIMIFNPWNFSDQNQLIQQFFNELSIILCRKDQSKRYMKIGQAIQKYSRFFEPFYYLPYASVIGSAAKALQRVGEAAKRSGKEESKNLSEVKKELNDLLKSMDRKILIIIDDIDRLNNVEIRQIFQLIKSIADFPNTIYVVSFDKEVVVNALRKVQEGNGLDYLEKVVQVPFDVPDISKEELETYLFKSLDKIVYDIPDEKWDHTYWANLYHSGLKYLFNNIRDVNRYVNTLRFSFPLIKDEVNPVDFLAITAIQVFIPHLYKDIKENDELFVGVKNDYDLHEQTEDEVKSKFNAIYEKVNELPKHNLIEFLQFLFPKLENVGHSSDFLNLWRKEGRICSPDIFNTFFKLSIGKNELSLSEINNVILKCNDVESFSRELLRLNQEGKIERFLERMEDYTREDIPKENISNIVTSLMDLGDLFPIGKYGFFTLDTPSLILRILYQLTQRFEDHDTRFEIFYDAINRAQNSIYTIVHEVGVQCQEHGKYGFDNDPKSPDRLSVTSEQLDKLVDLALNKLRFWSSNKSLITHSNFLSILFTWKRWGEEKEVNDYVDSLISEDHGLVKFLTHFLTEVKSHGAKDYVFRTKWRMDLNAVAQFVDLDEIDSRIRNIRSSPVHSFLTENDLHAIEIFISTRDGEMEDLYRF